MEQSTRVCSSSAASGCVLLDGVSPCAHDAFQNGCLPIIQMLAQLTDHSLNSSELKPCSSELATFAWVSKEVHNYQESITAKNQKGGWGCLGTFRRVTTECHSKRAMLQVCLDSAPTNGNLPQKRWRWRLLFRACACNRGGVPALNEQEGTSLAT